MGQNGGSPQHSQVEFVEELRNDARLYLIRLIRELAVLRYLGDYLNQDDSSFNTDSSDLYNYILNTVTTTEGLYTVQELEDTYHEALETLRVAHENVQDSLLLNSRDF